MNIYFDTEFTGLHKDTELISLGFISDDNRELYIEIDGIDIKKQDDWIKENVLMNTHLYGNVDISSITNEKNYFKCTKSQAMGVLYNWFRQFDSIQLVSDVCHYDFVLLIDIFGGAFDLPKNISPYCHDINQDIANTYGESDCNAFNMSREAILDDLEVFIDGNKHNALYDAKVIREIYRGCCQ